MGSDTALSEERSDYNAGRHKELVSWMERTGNSVKATAVMIGLRRSHKELSRFIENPAEPVSIDVYMAIDQFLNSSQVLVDGQANSDTFCKTSLAGEFWEAFQYCVKRRKMGAVWASSGTGKTFMATEFKHKHKDTVFIAGRITRRAKGKILSIIASHLGCGYYGERGGDLCLDVIIEHLCEWPRPLIIDEAHFLKWEVFEAIRTIYDNIPIGIIYLGQPLLYRQMFDKKNVWEQIFSRLAVRRLLGENIPRGDVKTIAASLYPQIDKRCVDFLHKKAQGVGKLRTMTNCLKLAMELAEEEGLAVSIPILKTASRFLVGG
jgi:DNA transposition AAA+ family ATPase